MKQRGKGRKRMKPIMKPKNFRPPMSQERQAEITETLRGLVHCGVDLEELIEDFEALLKDVEKVCVNHTHKAARKVAHDFTKKFPDLDRLHTACYAVEEVLRVLQVIPTEEHVVEAVQ